MSIWKNTLIQTRSWESRQSSLGNGFEVNFFKLMNKSVFGKILENIRNRVDIRLISSDKVAQKLAAKPNYARCTIFDENLMAVHMKKTKLDFNNEVYLGVTWVNTWWITFITIILRLNMGITKTYSLPTLTLSHMKLRRKIFTKISTPRHWETV